MNTIFDYIDWRGDIEIKHAPFCEVDNLILSTLTYMNLLGIAEGKNRRAGIPLKEAVEEYLKAFDPEEYKMGLLIPDTFPVLFEKAGESLRFGSMRVFGYKELLDEENQIQFAAMCFDMGSGEIYVAFRGTDDTIAGWKENFNMSYMDSVPAQRLALNYLEEIAKKSRFCKIRVGGHSKGGNLALYAAINAKENVQKRIVAVYNNDGPGFGKKVDKREEYKRISDRAFTIVPSFSVVGLLLEHGRVDKVVNSSTEGLWQHDPCTWEVLGDSFVEAEGLSEESRKIEKTLKALVAGLSIEERRELVEAFYRAFTANKASTLSDIAADKFDFLKALTKLDQKSRETIASGIKLLFRQGYKTIAESHLKKTMRFWEKKDENTD